MSMIRSRVSVAALAAALALSAPLHMAQALPDAGDPGVTAANQESAAEPRLRLSNAGYNAWRKVRAARIAIFNGDTALATEFIADARKDLAEARKAEEKSYVETTTMKVGDETRTRHWYAIDGAIDVLDDFVAERDAASHVEKANRRMASGEHKKAMEELKLAGVDVSYARMLLPLEKFEAEVTAAGDFAKDGKFYQADQALKRAEASMRPDRVMLMETPKGGATN